MNKRIKELNRINNELDKQVKKENDDAMTDIVCYLYGANISSYDQEMVRRDLLEMVLSAQDRGEGIKSVIGEDYKSFCDNIITSLPPRSIKERILEFLDIILICTYIFFGINIVILFFMDNLTNIIEKRAISFKLNFSGGVFIMYGISIVIIFLILQFIFKTAFRPQNKKDLIGYFLIQLAILSIFVGIAWIFKNTLFQVHILAAAAFIFILYVVHLFLNRVEIEG